MSSQIKNTTREPLAITGVACSAAANETFIN